MQCVLCHKKPATVSLKQVVNGNAKEWQLCPDCARAQGVDTQLPLPSLTEFLFSLAETAQESTRDEVCGACHMHLPDFHKTSLLGCPSCYSAFEGEVERLIAGMHKDIRHFGKVPKRHLTGFVRSLEQAIDAAVKIGRAHV